MATILPVSYEADRWFVHPIASSGERLRLFTDTGGADFLRVSTVSRLALPTETVEIEGEHLETTRLPAFDQRASIPDICVASDPRDERVRGRLLIRAEDASSDVGDGTLGQSWFGGRVWTFDYLDRTLAVSTGVAPELLGAPRVPIGFPRDHLGRPRTHFPSIEAEIEGETLPFLFDTGATLHLSNVARAQLDATSPAVGTCFVVASVFDRWRTDQPDWALVECADSCVNDEPAILVPTVSIAGLDVGPVWFTRRLDQNFHVGMSRFMDRRVDGALGGSCLRFFRVTVDYPGASAYFAQ